MSNTVSRENSCMPSISGELIHYKGSNEKCQSHMFKNYTLAVLQLRDKLQKTTCFEKVHFFQ